MYMLVIFFYFSPRAQISIEIFAFYRLLNILCALSANNGSLHKWVDHLYKVYQKILNKLEIALNVAKRLKV